MSIEIREISASEAQAFYRRFKQRGEQVSFSDKGKYFLAELDGQAAGIVSAVRVGKAVRVKSLIVRPGFRQKGVGTALLTHLIYDGVAYTAFATNYSRGLFMKFGFVEQSRKPNDISYMVKEVK